MRLLGYVIAAAAYIVLLLWMIDKRNPEVETPLVQNKARLPVSQPELSN
jgi:hypothetical protein